MRENTPEFAREHSRYLDPPDEDGYDMDEGEDGPEVGDEFNESLESD